MKNFFNQYIKKLLKSRNDWLLIYHLLHYFRQCLGKTPFGKMSFLSHPDIQLATSHTSLYLLSVKEKDENEDN